MLQHVRLLRKVLTLYTEEMLQAVTEAVFGVVDARLQRQHRLLVASCFGLVRLNMTCKKEDYVKAFLVPLNLDQTWLWEGVTPPKKKQAESDEEAMDKEKDVENGKDEEEEKVEEEEEKSADEEPEAKSDESMKEHDQEDESFPSWIPDGCNKKVCFVFHGNFSFQLDFRT